MDGPLVLALHLHIFDVTYLGIEPHHLVWPPFALITAWHLERQLDDVCLDFSIAPLDWVLSKVRRRRDHILQRLGTPTQWFPVICGVSGQRCAKAAREPPHAPSRGNKRRHRGPSPPSSSP